MERKEFIVKCGQFCLGGILGGSLFTSCAGNYYAATTLENNLIRIKKTEFIEYKDGKPIPRNQVLVRTEKLNFPICIYQLNENTYSALLMACTHNSCELNPSGDFLICPCHGSEFDKIGKVQNSPAEIDLKTFKTTFDHEFLYVHLS
jgi:cytochrome b6-f complex iron-sulfur subunit